MFLNNLAALYDKTNQLDKAIETYKSAITVSKKLKLENEEGYPKEIERLKKKLTTTMCIKNSTSLSYNYGLAIKNRKPPKLLKISLI